jgi:hypothetical protein
LPPGKTQIAYTAILSFNELTELCSQATGQPAKHRQVMMEEVKKRFPIEGEEMNSTMHATEFGILEATLA